MSTIRIAVRSWWKTALVASAIALAAIVPTSASAQAYGPSYTGYPGAGYYGNYGYGNGYGMGYIARTDYRGYGYIQAGYGAPVYGFRWTGYGWQRYQLASGRYYVTPYSGKWRWVQTGYGWLITSATVTVG